MKPLGCLGIGLSIVSGCLLLALVAELYYFFWWKKRSNGDIEGSFAIPVVELPYFFCLKKPCFLGPAALNPQEIRVAVNGAPAHPDDFELKTFGGEESAIDAELLSLAGPSRSLFTIEEETQEDLEAEERGSRKGGAAIKKSLRDLLLSNETPIPTPLRSPLPLFSSPRTPTGRCCSQNGFNPLTEAAKEDGSTPSARSSSPPPTFKFLKDAEDKLYRRTLMEEEIKVERSRRHLENKEAANGKNCSSQVTPLPTYPPSTIKQVNIGAPG